MINFPTAQRSYKKNLINAMKYILVCDENNKKKILKPLDVYTFTRITQKKLAPQVIGRCNKSIKIIENIVNKLTFFDVLINHLRFYN